MQEPINEPLDHRLHVTCGRSLIARIDEWRRMQPTLPNRSEAIRLLVEDALDAEGARNKGATKRIDVAQSDDGDGWVRLDDVVDRLLRRKTEIDG
jgi:Arc/MetJ-type ribon-helix-helix transcriptional regulator